MHVDGEEGLLAAVDGPPLGHNRLTARIPRRVGRVDTPGVILEQGPLENLVCVDAAALVRLVQLDDIGTVEVCAADVAAGLTAIYAILRLHLGKVILDAASLKEALGERGEGKVGADNAVVGGARAILNLLEDDEIGSAQLVDDLVNDLGEVRAIGGEVLGVVGGDGDTLAGALAGEADSVVLGGGIADGGDVGEGEDAVETKGVVDDSGDVAVIVAHLGVIRVRSAIERSADDNGLGVGI